MSGAPQKAAPEWLLAEIERVAALGESAKRPARDPVNQPMINNWVEALGDANPAYTDPDYGPVAPPAMIQAWTMPGLHGQRATDDPLGLMMSIMDDAGYTSVVATNSEQTYHRYLSPGEHVASSTKLENVVGPKTTGLGEGYFVTTKTTWWVGDEAVGEMRFRVLKFRPQTTVAAPQPEQKTEPSEKSPAAAVLRPVISQDTEFFWAGTKAGELRIQRWGDELRHPPGPMPPDGDLDAKPDYVVAAGTGTVYSYVVHHHPKVPGKQVPFVIALVELDEGVRVLGELLDADPESVQIGLPVEVTFVDIDDDLALPAWKVRS